MNLVISGSERSFLFIRRGAVALWVASLGHGVARKSFAVYWILPVSDKRDRAVDSHRCLIFGIGRC